MADSFIQLSPDSTGKKVDTRTAPDGDHREVQVIGSPTTADVAEADTANGLDVDVTRLPALPAGTNNIGDVDIVSLPNEGQQTMANSISVAIASDQSTVPVSLAAGGTTQYAEDTAHVSGDQVTMAGVVQQTADAALSTDGDRSALQVDASGFLKVNIKAGAGSGGTAMADDAAFTPAVTQGTPAFAFADESGTDSVDEGDAGALRMTLDRKLLTRVVGATDANRLDVDASGHAQVDIAAASVTVPVSAASLPLPTGAATSALQTQPGVDIGDVTVNNAAGASAVNVQDGGNSLTVDGTVAVSGSVDTELPAAAALADNTANPTVPAVGSFLMAFDGTNWDRVQTGAATGGALKVDGSAVTQPVSLTSTTITGTVTADTELPAAAALADATANPTTPLAGAALEMFNGTTWDRVRGDTTNGLDVDVTRLPSLVAGTANIGDVDVLTVPAPLSTSGGGTEATALRVTLANDSTGLVSVDDNGGSLTVDGTVTANPTAKTVLSTGGSASGSGNNTLIAAGTNRLKVFAFSLTTLSTTAMTCIFQSGAGGTELWRVVLQAPTSVSTGANLSVAPPAWLFATASATLLNLNLSSANAVNWSVAYYDEV